MVVDGAAGHAAMWCVSCCDDREEEEEGREEVLKGICIKPSHQVRRHLLHIFWLEGHVLSCARWWFPASKWKDQPRTETCGCAVIWTVPVGSLSLLLSTI